MSNLQVITSVVCVSCYYAAFCRHVVSCKDERLQICSLPSMFVFVMKPLHGYSYPPPCLKPPLPLRKPWNQINYSLHHTAGGVSIRAFNMFCSVVGADAGD